MPGLLLLISSCRGDRTPDSSPTSSSSGNNFELSCDATSMPEATNLFCVRLDTRNGDVKRVEIRLLPVSNGPTGTSQASGPGSYQLVCRSTSSDTLSEFFCIRLNTTTGEMLFINLPKVGSVPAE